jgi:hypothetical protein
VGLELRPRRLRDAANLFAALRDARGAAGRDAVWAHPDLLPTHDDLDDPLGFVESSEPDARSSDDFDTAMAQLLDDAGTDPASAPDDEGDASTDDEGTTPPPAR